VRHSDSGALPSLACGALVLGFLLTGGGAASAGWQVVWNDEFSGASVDSARWSFDIGNGSGGWGNRELEYYTSRPANVYVADGLLHMVALKESYQGFSYTSAKLKTSGLFSKLYGRFEFRAKLPQGKGYWPALWLMPRDSVYGGWAASGEVDIMENKGRLPTQVMGTLHFGGAYPNQAQSSGPSYSFSGGDSVTNFHVYALEWTTNQFSWYVDGKLYQTQTSWYSTGAAYPAPFNQPFYILMNLAVGGIFDGNPDGTTVFPGDMQVDYMRVYDWVPSAAAELNLRLAFDDPPGSTTTPSDTSDGGASLALQMLDGNGTPADYHGASGSGVAGTMNGTRALDFSSNGANQPGIPGPLAATTNANLGFGTVSNFTVSLWFKQNALMASGANIGPRLFVLGGGVPADTDAANSIGLKFQSAGQLYFQMNGLTVPFSINLQTNNWVFVAATYDGNSVTIYQGTDGAVSSASTNVAITTNVNFGLSGALYIGNRQDRQRSFDGRIDDFRFYRGLGDAAFVENVRLLAARPPWGLAAAAGDSQAELSWGTALGATSYNVKRATSSGGPYNTLSAGQQVTDTAFTDATASNGLTYYYVVASVNPAGEGAVSAEASATPGPTNPPPSLSLQTLPHGLVLNWSSGTLQSATNVPGPWFDVEGAVSPCTNPFAAPQQFFRLR
jgi:beta-glucanase (GH16 family)